MLESIFNGSVIECLSLSRCHWIIPDLEAHTAAQGALVCRTSTICSLRHSLSSLDLCSFDLPLTIKRSWFLIDLQSAFSLSLPTMCYFKLELDSLFIFQSEEKLKARYDQLLFYNSQGTADWNHEPLRTKQVILHQKKKKRKENRSSHHVRLMSCLIGFSPAASLND
jgi:hypothetical protein